MKILRRSLCIISIILFSFALSILIPSVQASKIVLDDLIIFFIFNWNRNSGHSVVV